nr:hypothetical protein [uncultured Roseateles sp.]
MNLLMTMLSALAYAAATLCGLALMFVGTSEMSARDGERGMTSVIIGLPFGLCLLLAFGVAVSRDGFGWIAPSSRGLQWALVMAAVLSAVLVVVGSAALRWEPAEQVPWALWPLRAWAPLVWPPLLLAALALALWPGLRAELPAPAWQAPVAALGLVALLAGATMLVQWVQASVEREAAEVQAAIDRDSNRNRQVLEDVEKADPVKNLVSLMNQTSQFELPQIRERALAKVHAHPDLNAALAEMLRNGWRDYALTFLESNDAPDPAALADAVRDAILGTAEDFRERMRDTHTLRSDEFEPEVRRLLAVADKYQALGGDYVDAVRAVRAALDEPRQSWQPTAPLACRRTLDQWLQAHRR